MTVLNLPSNRGLTVAEKISYIDGNILQAGLAWMNLKQYSAGGVQA